MASSKELLGFLRIFRQMSAEDKEVFRDYLIELINSEGNSAPQPSFPVIGSKV